MLNEFLTRYDGNPFPSKTIALNVLEDLGVPTGALERTLDLIVSGGRTLGLLDEIAGKTYVRIGDVPTDTKAAQADDGQDVMEETPPASTPLPEEPTVARPAAPVVALPEQNDRVFITHGSNLKIVEQIKEVLSFGKFTPVVSVEREAVAKPVPDKASTT